VRCGPHWRGVQGDRGEVDAAGGKERRHEGSSPAPCRWVAKAALLDLVTGAEEVDGEAYAVGPWTFDIDAGALRRGLRAMVMEITRRRSGPDRRLLASVADN
jgi:hypothetical protein